MRAFPAAALIPLAALLAAAKPVDPVRDVQAEARRSIFRATAQAMCISELASDTATRPANFGRICSCAPERYLANHPTGDLPAIDARNFRAVMAAEIAACGGGASVGDKTADDGLPRGAIAAPPAVEPPEIVPSETDSNAANSTVAKPEGGSMFGWLDDLSLPSLGGMPDWGWWGLLGLLIVLFFARRVFRGDPGRHLDGPPRSMKPSAPVQPRHPNLPPRG